MKNYSAMSAAEFKKYRLEMNLTQTQLATLLDMSPRQLSRVETGQRNIQITTSLAMAFLRIMHDVS